MNNEVKQSSRKDTCVGYLPATLYHIAEASNWPFIQQHGLQSAHNLLKLAGLSEKERTEIEYRQRTEYLLLPNGIIIRDQKPMAAATLARCLVGITPDQWYKLLNSRVFFWLNSERMNRMRKALGEQPQIVLTIDTKQLLERYAEQVTLTPINTGNARRHPALRGRSTFVPYKEWVTSGWTSETESLGTGKRSRSHRPVELTVEGAIPDIMDFVAGIQRLEAGELLM